MHQYRLNYFNVMFNKGEKIAKLIERRTGDLCVASFILLKDYSPPFLHSAQMYKLVDIKMIRCVERVYSNRLKKYCPKLKHHVNRRLALTLCGPYGSQQT